ncbi:MAG: hypothetical protein HYV07_13230 [Deltaproteobacteria bacterium]|nr:hypothetical protein [Deltaproteobacteria bacterium]
MGKFIIPFKANSKAIVEILRPGDFHSDLFLRLWREIGVFIGEQADLRRTLESDPRSVDMRLESKLQKGLIDVYPAISPWPPGLVSPVEIDESNWESKFFASDTSAITVGGGDLKNILAPLLKLSEWMEIVDPYVGADSSEPSCDRLRTLISEQNPDLQLHVLGGFCTCHESNLPRAPKALEQVLRSRFRSLKKSIRVHPIEQVRQRKKVFHDRFFAFGRNRSGNTPAYVISVGRGISGLSEGLRSTCAKVSPATYSDLIRTPLLSRD